MATLVREVSSIADNEEGPKAQTTKRQPSDAESTKATMRGARKSRRKPKDPERGTVSVRLASDSDDIEKMVVLGAMMHRESGYASHPYDADKLRTRGERALEENGRTCLLMAERGGEPIGMLFAVVSEFYFSRALGATALAFFVVPEHRGGMAAIKLLHGFRRWAQNRKVAEISIHVTSGVHMARTDKLLKRLGFKMTGGNYSMSAET